MDHFRNIYQNKALEYHQMIAAEDVDGNLTPALRSLLGNQRRILDFGAGTGRISLLLHPLDYEVTAIDLHLAMLLENKQQRNLMGGRWPLLCSDMRCLPFPSQSWEAAIAGWAIGHLRAWYDSDWEKQIGAVISEMNRVVQPNGTLIILETLGTGFSSPQPPSPQLAEYYKKLEEQWGFSRQEIQTDYLFKDVDDAVDKTSFFFGRELAEKVVANNWQRLPEWTGLWSRTT
jgi:ubiquinone/menaquinone biosynthesis C-methylase UbiE